MHGDEKARDAHRSYLAAKAGDFRAAFWLVEDMLNETRTIDLLKQLCDKFDATLLPFTVDEALGYNAIPDALASSLWFDLPRKIEEKGRIVQSNKVAHTRAPGFQRIVTPASFSGTVTKGARYFIVDDHTGFGGTIANLCGFVVASGASGVGVTTLTASPNSHKISVSQETLDVIFGVYGKESDQFWLEQFGHTINCFTQQDAILVSCQRSLKQLKDCLAQATSEVRARGL